MNAINSFENKIVKHTKYFLAMRTRPDRVMIRDEWIERAIRQPVKEIIQADGRIRRWARTPQPISEIVAFCFKSSVLAILF